MFKHVLILISALGLSMPAAAQDKSPALPKNTINCKQFKKTGPNEWIEVGTAVFDLGEIDDINLTDQPVTPGYFKFGGIDLFPVLEKKCGTPAPKTASASNTAPASDTAASSNTTPAAQPSLMATGPVLKEEPSQNRDAEKAGYLPAQPSKDQDFTTPVSRKADTESEQEIGPCPSKKLVYAANSPGGIQSDAPLIELVFDSKHKEDLETAANSDFEIREYKNNQLGWTYKGKFLQREPRSRFGFPLFEPRRKRSVWLEPRYIKPNRDGTGEPILYVAGLNKLAASKKKGRAAKAEGNRPPDALPEVFYFDRCE